MEIMLHVKLVKPESASNKEFFEVWQQESDAVLAAVKAGAIKNVWKVAGKYEVMAVLEVENADQMDEALHSLPVWRNGYAHIVPEITWTPLRSYENWAEQLKTLSQG